MLAGVILCHRPALAQTPAQPAAAAKPWWERITFGGDLRGRYEGFFQEDRETRHRPRARFRFRFGGEINPEVGFGVRLASGDPKNPTSANQTFTEFWTRKPFYLDQFYMTYRPRVARWLTLGGGKFPYPVTRTQLVWDDDINWEGLYQEIAPPSKGRVTFRLVTIQSPLNEVAAARDAWMFGEYAQINIKVAAHTLQLSVADYAYREVDQIAVGIASGVLHTQNTNALRRSGRDQVTGFVSRFNLVDVIAQLTLATGRADYPVVLTANFVKNTRAATDRDLGFWLVAGYGRAATPGTGSAEYTFTRIEEDAVLTPFNFDDIPGSDMRGHIVTLSYMILPRTNVDFRGLFSKRLLFGPKTLLSRIQIDARVSF